MKVSKSLNRGFRRITILRDQRFQNDSIQVTCNQPITTPFIFCSSLFALHITLEYYTDQYINRKTENVTVRIDLTVSSVMFDFSSPFSLKNFSKRKIGECLRGKDHQSIRFQPTRNYRSCILLFVFCSRKQFP